MGKRRTRLEILRDRKASLQKRLSKAEVLHTKMLETNAELEKELIADLFQSKELRAVTWRFYCYMDNQPLVFTLVKNAHARRLHKTLASGELERIFKPDRLVRRGSVGLVRRYQSDVRLYLQTDSPGCLHEARKLGLRFISGGLLAERIALITARKLRAEKLFETLNAFSAEDRRKK